ncbi:FG-GAP repeat domain-containing protein [Streptomyces sp. NPDC094038]|uniref:FG-GAP repeat domain-containing protein n=1 Tax=Streptomyces sp. NPDC094038 TaxID=3366055 RepID=UPI003811E3B9
MSPGDDRLVEIGGTGDGKADLLAQDKSDNLYRYNGRDDGTFAARVKVFSRWGGSYNAVVGVGDITGDGRPDLVSRDTSGKAWRNNGDGKGSFGARAQIASGWGGYKSLSQAASRFRRTRPRVPPGGPGLLRRHGADHGRPDRRVSWGHQPGQTGTGLTVVILDAPHGTHAGQALGPAPGPERLGPAGAVTPGGAASSPWRAGSPLPSPSR